MVDSPRRIPAHEEFGYAVTERAIRGEWLESWEDDFAHLFWQSLEIHNGGFYQWIGNTGVGGALETLEILDRYRFAESHRATREAFAVVQLRSWVADQSFFD